MNPFRAKTFILIGVVMALGCATSRVASKADKLEQQGQLAQAAQLEEKNASDHSGKVAAKAWYHAGNLWLDPNNPQKSFKRALTCFSRVDHTKVDKQMANSTRLWISVLTQLMSEKQKTSVLKGTAAALKDAAESSERLHPATPTIPVKTP